MAVLRPVKQYVYNNAQIFPASIYSRPALPPFFVGMNGLGQAARYNTQQFQYTLQQMAASPFAVNNQAYIERIRKEYGYKNNGLYDTFGTIGGVTGAAMGALWASGAHTDLLKMNGIDIMSNTPKDYNLKFRPRRTAFHENAFSRNTLIREHRKTFDMYTDHIKKYNKALDQFNTYGDTLKKLNVIEDIKDFNIKELDSLWATVKYRKNIDPIKTAVKEARDAYNTMDSAADIANTTGDTLRAAGLATDSVKAGTKAVTKGIGLMPAIGTAADVTSLGLSAVGFSQSLRTGNPLHIGLNTISLIADAADVAGDVLTMTGIGVPIGATLSVVAGVVSLGVSAIQGWLVGETIGRSLSPEGLKAQQLFAENLYSGIINRPITTVGATLAMVGVPYALNKLASGKGILGNLPLVHGAASWLTSNAIGNQVRAGISMMTLQGISQISAKLDEALPWVDPDPYKANFVSAISVYGDINDNLYGATRNKSILLGLIEKDPHAMVEAFARSWGRSDDIYKSVSFDDIREAAGIDAGVLGNSFISTIGELIIDPQNFREVYDRYATEQITKSTTQLLNRIIDFEAAKAQMRGGVGEGLGLLVDNHGLFAHKYGAAYRHSTMYRIVQTYITEGHKGVIKLLDSLTTHNVKDALGDAQYKTGNLSQQRDVLLKALDDIFINGTFTYKVGTEVQRTRFKRDYNKYLRMRNKEYEEGSKEAEFVQQVSRTMMNLKEMYKDRADESYIVSKFIKDFDIKIDTKLAAKLYTSYADMRYHMDMMDVFATGITKITNPTATAFKGLRFALGKWFESRRATTDMRKQAQTIIDIDKFIEETDDNIKELYKIYENPITDKTKKASEQLNKTTETLEEFFDRTAKQNERVAKIFEDVAANFSASTKEEFKKTLEDIEETKRLIKQRKEAYAKDKSLIDYAPITYKNKAVKITVTKNNYKRIQEEIDVFEKNVPNYKELLTRKNKSDGLKKYIAQKSALTYFLYHTKHNKAVNKVLEQLLTANAIIAETSAAEQKSLLNLLKLLHVYKGYTNTIKKTTRKGVTYNKKQMEANKLIADYFNKNVEALEELDRISALYGVQVDYKYEDQQGNIVQGNSLSKIILGKITAIHELDITYKESIQQAITKAIYNKLPLSDTELLMLGITKVPNTINKTSWRKATTKERFDIVRNLINKVGLATEDNLKEILSGDTLNKIVKEINKILTSRDPLTRTVQAEDITENLLREIVYGSLYNKNNSPIKKQMDAAIRYFKKAQKITTELLENQKDTDFKEVLEAEIKLVNSMLHNNPGYEFFRSYFFLGEKKTTDALFLTYAADTELLPKLPKEQIKDTNVYTLEEHIKQYKNSKAVQFLLKTKNVEEDTQYILDRHNNVETEDIKNAKQKALKEVRQKRAVEDRRRSRIINKVEETINTSKAKVLNSIDNKNFTNLNPNIERTTLFKGKNKSDLVSFVRKILTSPYKIYVYNLNFSLQASKFIDHNETNPSKMKSYYTVLNKTRNKSRGHYDYITKMFRNLLEDGKYYKFDWTYLNQVKLRHHKTETELDYKTRVLVENYKRERKIDVRFKLTSDRVRNKLNTILSKNFYKAIIDYMETHAQDMFELGYEVGLDGYYKDTDIEAFKKRLQTRADKFDYTIYETIFNAAVKYTNEDFIYKHFDSKHKALQDTMKHIREYEIKDIKSISDRYYTLAYDVVKSLIYGNPRYEAFIKEALKYPELDFNNEDDVTKLESPLFQVLFLLDKYIATDKSYKQTLEFKNLKDSRIDEQGNVVLYIGKQEVSMFELLLNYHISIQDLYALRNVVTKNKLDKEATEIRKQIEIEYNQLVNQYGTLLVQDAIEVPRETFSGTDEEYTILTNMVNRTINNSLTMNLFLDTRKKSHSQRDYINNIKNYLNEHVINIYEKALKDFDNTAINTIRFKNTRIAKPQQLESLFAIYILRSKLDDNIKRSLFRDILFHNQQVSVGYATKKNIKKLQEAKAGYRKPLQKLKAYPDEYKDRIEELELKIKDIDLRINAYKVFNKNIDASDYKDTDNFFDYLNDNPDEIDLIFNRDYSTDMERYTLAYDETLKKYVVIENSTNRVPNYIDRSKGLPTYNSYIGELIINKDDPNYTTKLNTNLQKEYPGMYQIIYASKKGLLIETEESIDKNKIIDIIVNNDNLTYVKNENIYIVNKKQLTDIKQMARTGVYINTFDYTTKRRNNKIVGEVNPKIINTSGKHGTTPLYIQDIETIRKISKQNKIDIKTMMNEYMEYLKIKAEKNILDRGYVTNIGFHNSGMFKELHKSAQLEEAFLKFIRLIGGNKDFNKYSLDSIGKLFFNNKYISRLGDGTLYNIDKIDSEIPKLKLTELTKIKISKDSLIYRVKNALKEMQRIYGDSNINFNYNDILNKTYLSTLRELKSTAYNFMRSLGHKHFLYQKMANKLKYIYKKGIEYHITPEEMSERQRIISNLIPKHNKAYKYLDQKDHIEDAIKSINILKEMFESKKDGITLEHNLYTSTSDNRNRHKKRVKALNDRVRGNTHKIKYDNLKYLFTKNDKQLLAALKIDPNKIISDELLDDLITLANIYKSNDISQYSEKAKQLYLNRTKTLANIFAEGTTEKEAKQKIITYILRTYINAARNRLITKNTMELVMRANRQWDPNGKESLNDVFHKLLKQDKDTSKEAWTDGSREYFRKFKGTALESLLAKTFEPFNVNIRAQREQTDELIANVLNIVEAYVFDGETKYSNKEQPTKETVKQYTSKEQYLNDIEDSTMRNFTSFFIDLEILKKTEKGKTVEQLLKDSNLTETDLNDWQEVDADVFKVMYNIFNKKKGHVNKTFSTNSEMYNLLSNPLLDDSLAFKEYVEKMLLNKDVLKALGLKDYEATVKLFNNYTTMKSIIETIKSKLNSKEMFALITVLNELKINYFYKEHGNNWSWKYVKGQHDDKVTHDNLHAIMGVSLTNVLERNYKEDVFDNSFTNSVNDSLDFIDYARTYAETMNNKLNILRIPIMEDVKQESTIKPQYVMTAETNLITLTRDIQRKATAALFKHDTSSLSSAIRYELEKALGDVSFFLIAEQYADKVEHIQAKNSTYFALVKGFTDAVRQIHKGFKESQFVTLSEIGNAFTAIFSDRHLITAYKAEYARTIKLIPKHDTTRTEALKKAIDDLIKIFASKEYLIDAKENRIKAALGFILSTKFNRGNTENTERQQRILKNVTQQLKREHRVANYELNKITNHLDSIADINKLVKSIYPKELIESLTGQDKQNALDFISNIKDLKTILLNELTLKNDSIEDTYEMAMLDDVDYEYDKLPQVIKHTQIEKQIETIKQQIESKKHSINYYKGVFKFANTDSNMVEQKRNELIDMFNKLNNKLTELKQEEKDIRKDRKELYQKLLKEIFLNNPELVKDYINKAKEFVSNKIQEATIEYDKVRNKRAPEFLAEYDKRLNKLEVLNKFFHTDEYILYQKINKDTNKNLYPIYKDEAEVLGIKSKQKFFTWLKQIETKHAQINQEIKDLKTPAEIVNAKGYTIKWEYNFNLLHKAEVTRQNRIEGLNKYLAGVVDIDILKNEETLNQKQYHIIKHYLNEIQNKYTKAINSKKKDTFKNLEETKIKGLTRKDINDLTETSKNFKARVTKQLENQINYLKTLTTIKADNKNYKDVVEKEITKLEESTRNVFKNPKPEKLDKQVYKQAIIEFYTHLINDSAALRNVKATHKDYKRRSIQSLLKSADTILHNIYKQNINYEYKHNITEIPDDVFDYIFTEIHNKVNHNYNVFVEARISYLSDLSNNITKTIQALKNNETIQNKLDNSRGTSIKKLFSDATKIVNQDLPGTNIASVINYFVNEDIETFNKDLIKKQNEIKQVNAELNPYIKQQEQLVLYTQSLPNVIEGLERNLKQREIEEEKLRKRINNAQKKRDKEKPHKNTNIGTYKNLYGFDKETTDRDVLRDVLRRSEKNFTYIDENNKEITLRQFIKDNSYNGKIDVHNSIVDTLITRLNYIAQKESFGEPIPKEFLVLDIETITNTNGNKEPYQITMLRQKMVNGKPVIDIANHYISNSIFINEDATKELDGFYEQQFEIAQKHKPNITREMSNKETDALIEHVKYQSNDILFVKTFINVLNIASKDIPTVAHNGKRFDLVHYNNFIKRIARTLLTNQYHKSIRQVTPEVIENKLKSQGVTWTSKDNLIDRGKEEAVIKEYEKVIKKIKHKYNRGMEITDNEMRQLDKFQNAINKLHTLRTIRNAENVLGTITNVKIKESLFTGEDSQVEYINNLFFEYVTSDNTVRADIEQELIAYFTRGWLLHHTVDESEKIAKWVREELLAKSEEQYQELIKGTKSIDYNTQETYKTYHNLIKKTVEERLNFREEVNSEISPYKMIRNAEIKIKQLQNHMSFLRRTDDTSKTNRIKEFTEEQITYQEDIKVLNERVDELKEIIKTAEDTKVTSLDAVNKAVKTIQDFTDNLTYRANIIISKELEKELENRGIAYGDRNNANLIKFEMQQQLTAIKEGIELITRISNLFKTTDVENKKDLKKLLESKRVKELLEKDIDPKIFEVKTKEDIELKKAEYDKKIKELSKYMDVKNASLLKGGLKEITTKYNKIIENLNRRLSISKNNLINSWNKYATNYMKVTPLKLEDLTKDNLNKLHDQLKNVYRKFKDDQIYQTILTNVSTSGDIVKLLDVLESKETIEAKIDTANISNLIVKALNKDILYYQHNKDMLDLIDLKEGTYKNSYTALTDVLNKTLEKVQLMQDLEKEIEYEDVFNALRGVSKNINDGDYKTLKEEASKRIKNEAQVIHNMHIKNVQRVYADYNEGTPIEGLALNPDKVFKTENKDRVTISVPTAPDKFGNTYVQQFSFNKNYPSKIEFTMVYYYTEAGKPLVYRKPKQLSYTAKDADDMSEYLNKLYNYKDPDGKAMLGHTGLNKALIDTNNDPAKKSIQKLLDVYHDFKKNGAFSYIEDKTKRKEHYDKILKDVIDDKRLVDSSFIKVDITGILKQRFYDYLNMVRFAKRNEKNIDLTKVYRGLMDTILSKYAAMESNKYINMIPPEYSTNYIAKWTAKEAKRLGINLELSAEGSAGYSTTKATQANVNKLHTFNTNAIRNILSLSKIYLNYTPIGIINEVYKYEDEHDETDFKKTLVEYITSKKNKTLNELLLYKDEKGNYMNTLTPNIMTEQHFKMYKDDVLHKIGLNLKVGFMDHPHAFEDTLLIDSSLAQTVGWDEGNKTWLGLYGFKGAVKYMDGLYKKFGVHIMGSKKSVRDRGAYGAPLDMALNTIRKYLLNDKTINTIDAFYRPALEKEFTIKEGKLILDPSKDYDKVLNKIFATKPDGKTKLSHTWKNIINKTFTKDLAYEYTHSDGTLETLQFKNTNMYQGEMYVIMDAEHTAEHMSTKTQINEAGEVTFAVKDMKGGVRKGVSMSPSVTDILELKGVDWMTAILGKQTDSALAKYSNIYNFGFKKILERFGIKTKKGKYNISATITNIKEQYSNILVEDIQRYLLYTERLEKIKDPIAYAKLETKIEELEYNAQKKSLEIIQGSTGALYEDTFHRHDGIRQQLVANPNLGQGQIRTSKDGWETLQDLKKGFLVHEPITDIQQWRKLIGGYKPFYAKNLDKLISKDGLTLKIKPTKKFFAFLNSIGVMNTYKDKKGKTRNLVNGEKITMYTINKNGTLTFNKNKLGQLAGYVVAMRSPVQDYNSVPMLKVIGHHTHNAVESNIYLYGLIGGDNDGDTIGMLALDSHEEINGKIQKSYFDNVDATKDEYYDTGTIADINDKQSKLLGVEEHIDNMDIRFASVGKKTFGQMKTINTAGEKIKVPIRDHYSWGEIFGGSDKNIQKDIDNLDVTDIDITKWGNSTKRFYLNVAVRKQTQGENVLDNLTEQDYLDTNKVTALLKGELATIAKRYYLFDMLYNNNEYDITQYVTKEDFENNQMHLSLADRKTIKDAGINSILIDKDNYKDLFNKIINNKIYTDSVLGTVERIQTSKIGINVFGSNRKTRTVSSLLSKYLNINRDANGNVWNPFRDKEGNITMESISRKLLPGLTMTNYFNDKDIYDEDAMNKLQQTFINDAHNNYLKDNMEDYYKEKDKPMAALLSLDIDLLLKDIFDTYLNSKRLEQELTSLAHIYHNGTAKDFAEHFKTFYGDKLNSLYKDLVEKLENYTYDKINKADQTLINMFYFGRYHQDAETFMKLSELMTAPKQKDKITIEDLIKQHTKNYYQQIIIDRAKQGAQSDDATEIIGVAKHAGRDMDKTIFFERYSKRLKEETEKTSIRHATVGYDKVHKRTMAIGMDVNPFEKNNIVLEKDPALEQRIKDLKAGERNTQLRAIYTKETYARNAATNLITEYAKSELFNDANFIPEIYNEVYELLNEVMRAFNTSKELKQILDTKITVAGQAQTVNNALQTLVIYDIPAYRVLRVLTNAFSLYQEVNNRYHMATQKALPKTKIPYVYNGFGLFTHLSKFKSRHERDNLRQMLDPSYQGSLDFLLNNRDVDYDYVTLDINGNITRREAIDYKNDGLSVPRIYAQEMISKISSSNDYESNLKIYDQLNALQQKTVINFIEDKELNSIKDNTSLELLIQNIKNDMNVVQIIYKDKDQQYKDTLNKITRDDVANSLTNKNLYSYHNIRGSVNVITEANNNYKEAQKELADAEDELHYKESQITKLNEKIAKSDKAIEYLNDIDYQKQIEDLEGHQKEAQETILKNKKFAAKNALNANFSKALLLLNDPKGKTIYDLYEAPPKYIGENPEFNKGNADSIKNTNLTHLQKYQTPFLTLIDLYKKNGVYDWEALFKYYKENRRFIRLTIVMDGMDHETLVRKLGDILRLEDKEYSKKSNWAKMLPWNIYKHRKASRFNSFEDAIEYMKKLETGKETEGIKINGKTYDKVDLNGLDLNESLSPTLKEINIRNAEDFKKVYKLIQQHISKTDKELSIGFVTMNDFMDAYDIAYKPFQLTGDGVIADVVSSLQYSQKLFMRLSMGFLFRNYIDTWTQLMSEMYQQEGMYGAIAHAPEIVRIMGLTGELYKLYQDIYEERLFTQIDIKSKYVEIEQIFTKSRENHGVFTKVDAVTIIKNIVDIRNRVYNYLEGVDKVGAIKSKMERRAAKATKILDSVDKMLDYICKNVMGIKSIKDIEVLDDPKFKFKNKNGLQSLDGRTDIRGATTFILNINFAEYFTLYDTLQFDPTKDNKYRKRINRLIKRQSKIKMKDKTGNPIYQDVEHILFEISAFMQTNAQIDAYKQEHYAYLNRVVESRRSKEFYEGTDRPYEEVAKEVDKVSRMFNKEVTELMFEPYKFYNKTNEWIENTARIGGYLFDRYLYKYSFNETVNRSLKRWFNYGQRTPMEMQLITDIPYLSFPIRSIDNWLNRMLDPSYNRLISDIVDGVYAQYEDEDGMYDPYERFQIANGWLPVGGGVGLRLGFGLYDVQNILNNTAATVEQRRNPLLRAIQTLIKEKDIVTSLKQLATVGVITRTANTLGPRNIMQASPTVQKMVSNKPRRLGNTFNFMYNYYEDTNPYTPYKYRNQNKYHNGRYTRYENIYRQWFNKYGKMRQPTVDPLSLVKDNQWKQYVRYKQSRNMLYYR